VSEERLGARVQEHEAREVGRALRLHVRLREEGEPQSVRGDHIEPTVLHDHGDAGHRVDGLLHAGSHLLLPSRSLSLPGPGALVRRADEIVQMGALGVIELQRTADPLEHRF
jgi:hypothetical protein